MEQNTQKALLVMDMQTSILSMLPDTKALIYHTRKAIAAAREKAIPVIYVVVGFRQGMPEVSSKNIGFSAMKEKMAGADMDQWMTIHPELKPQEGDIVVTKRRISAFTGSDLEVVLRGQNVQHVVLTGVATSGVVLSTIREAYDKDYQLSIISDCCKDADEEVDRVLKTKVFPRQGDVISMEDWISEI